MAYQMNRRYEYGTSPRKLKPEYEPINNPNQYKSKKTSTVKKVNRKTKTKLKIKPRAKLVLYIAIGFLALFSISYRNSLIAESFNDKEKLKQDVSSIQKENEQLINNDAQQYILTADLINSETIDPLIGMENISLQSLHQAK